MKLSNAYKIYNEGRNNEIYALKNINLELSNVGLVSICGESGCGKTTLLNILAGLDTLSKGNFDSGYKNNYASFVFQDAQLVQELDLYQNLKIVGDAYNTSSLIDGYLNRFNLLLQKNNFPNELSGGQKTKVAIIRALLANLPVIFCDEPTASLDKDSKVQIAIILKEISKDRLVIVSSHDTELFEKYSDRIIKISYGEIISDEVIKDTPALIDTSIDTSVSVKTIFNISLVSIKRKLPRFIIMLLSLALLFSVICITLNVILLNEASARNKVYRENGVEYVDYFTEEEKDDELSSDGITDYELKNVKYDFIKILSFDSRNKNNHIERLYVTNECKYKILYGVNKVFDGEIIISDVVASYITNRGVFSSLIGQNIIFECTNLKVVGIFKTGMDTDLQILNNLTESAFVNENTISLIESSTKEQNKKDLSIAIKEDGLQLGNSAAVDKNLSSNHVIVTKNFAKCNNINEDTINKEINLNICNQYYYQKTDFRKYDYFTSYKLIVDEIIDDTEDRYNYIMCSIDMYNTLYNDTCGILKCKRGFAINDYSKKTISTLLDAGFVERTYLEAELISTIDFVSLLGKIEMIILSVLIVLCVLFILNYTLFSFEKTKREIGILSSFCSKQKMAFIYYFEFMILTVSALVISIPISILFTKIENVLIIKRELINVDYIYNSIWPYIIAFVFMLIILIVHMVFIKMHLKKKTKIDLIYER